MMPFITPRIKARLKIDDPPYEIKGSVMPVTGNIPRFMPIETKNWNRIRLEPETKTSIENVSFVLAA